MDHELPEEIKQALIERRSELESLSDGEFAIEYATTFGVHEDFIPGRKNRTERMLLQLRHELDRRE
jgi:hypothetical protein